MSATWFGSFCDIYSCLQSLYCVQVSWTDSPVSSCTTVSTVSCEMYSEMDIDMKLDVS